MEVISIHLVAHVALTDVQEVFHQMAIMGHVRQVILHRAEIAVLTQVRVIALRHIQMIKMVALSVQIIHINILQQAEVVEELVLMKGMTVLQVHQTVVQAYLVKDKVDLMVMKHV